MPGITDTSIIQDILKEDYHGPLRKQLNDDVVLVAQIEKNTTSFAGKYAIVPIRFGRNAGVGARQEGEVMPRSGHPKSDKATVHVRKLTGVLGMTREAIDQAATDRGAFVRTNVDLMDDLRTGVTVDKARQTWGNADGVLANCGTTTGSTTVQLAAATPEMMMVILAEGMQVDIGTVANPQLIAADREITAVDFDNKTVTISGAAITTSASHYLFRQGSGGSGANQREITGMQAIGSDTTTLYGIAPADNFAWAAMVDDAGGTARPISENLVERVLHRAQNRSGIKVGGWYCGDGVYRAITDMLKGRQRVVNDISLKGGHTGIDFTFGAENAAVIRDRHAEAQVPGQLWGIDYSALEEYVLQDWQWEDELGSGQILRLSPDRTQTYEAWYYTERELGCSYRNRIVVLKDIETH